MTNVENQFRQPVSVDFAPAGSVCEWCEEPAVQTLTVLGAETTTKVGTFAVFAARNSFVWLPASSVVKYK